MSSECSLEARKLDLSNLSGKGKCNGRRDLVKQKMEAGEYSLYSDSGSDDGAVL